jgi:hypothetical protein
MKVERVMWVVMTGDGRYYSYQSNGPKENMFDAARFHKKGDAESTRMAFGHASTRKVRVTIEEI